MHRTMELCENYEYEQVADNATGNSRDPKSTDATSQVPHAFSDALEYKVKTNMINTMLDWDTDSEYDDEKGFSETENDGLWDSDCESELSDDMDYLMQSHDEELPFLARNVSAYLGDSDSMMSNDESESESESEEEEEEPPFLGPEDCLSPDERTEVIGAAKKVVYARHMFLGQ
ncbi:uncharacterized protein RCC_07144 [Ramularia collo-cygni]|uniref:Uncharacterized protein n=1 Tax=Ramularia collo-cygni TaxID=112498 RepID=A0A2D3UWV1_9PEZI|nr:uncharacterized protein RCC_07144 [Ramularia collo-cygni]CZT21281.1 uncharacterized protein RCC_07144 [Ramularia collo-cygni]